MSTAWSERMLAYRLRCGGEDVSAPLTFPGGRHVRCEKLKERETFFFACCYHPSMPLMQREKNSVVWLRDSVLIRCKEMIVEEVSRAGKGYETLMLPHSSLSVDKTSKWMEWAINVSGMKDPAKDGQGSNMLGRASVALHVGLWRTILCDTRDMPPYPDTFMLDRAYIATMGSIVSRCKKLYCVLKSIHHVSMSPGRSRLCVRRNLFLHPRLTPSCPCR